MSVSDPAPLPRLGEVFFDVRGNSRSMRLSWYADTGVAVFSIWQAGMCTGTFRLPIADLGRMIELLQRGPAPRRRAPTPLSGGERVDRGFDRPSGNHRAADDEPGAGSGDDLADFVQGDFASDYGAVDYRAAGPHAAGVEQHPDYEASRPARSHGAPGPGFGDQPAGDHGPGYQGGDSRGDRWADYPASGHGADERAGPGYSTDYPGSDYRETRDRQYADRDFGAPGYGRADPSQAAYPAADEQAGYEGGERRTDGGYRPSSYEPADYWSRGSGHGEPGYASGDYSAGGFDSSRGSDPVRDYQSGGVGYRDDRVVPPYVQGQEESYLNDNLAPGGGYQRDIGDPAYPADRRPVSPSHGYPEPPGQQDSYSYGSDYGSDYRYRLAADTESDEANSVGRSSGRRGA